MRKRKKRKLPKEKVFRNDFGNVTMHSLTEYEKKLQYQNEYERLHSSERPKKIRAKPKEINYQLLSDRAIVLYQFYLSVQDNFYVGLTNSEASKALNMNQRTYERAKSELVKHGYIKIIYSNEKKRYLIEIQRQVL